MTTDMQRQALLQHLETGVTTVCRCWSVTRRDGLVLGFTDHDRPLDFEGVGFSPDSGLEGTTLVQTTGLAVDNAEGMGVLSDTAISEADLMAGRYDSAVVRSWLVNWRDVEARALQFTGSLGEVRRIDGAFRAELRGLTEALNQPQGFVYQKPCSAVLGDARCQMDLDAPGMSADVEVQAVDHAQVFQFTDLGGFEDGWFTRGRFVVLSGAAEGLVGLIKSDRSTNGSRDIELWQELRAVIAVGDMVRVEAGCDRRAETCRTKFDNFLNFRGFPHIPGEDWLMSYPTSGSHNSGGSNNLAGGELHWSQS